jgi:hypothetical protein
MNTATRRIGLASLVLAALWAAGGGPVRAADPGDPKAGTKLDAPALARLIDQHINQRLDAEKVPPSPRADDAEFLRRAYLDITGVIPPADKVAAFLDSTDPDKRARLVDELLDSPQYGRHQADIWQAMLLPRTSDNRRLQTQPLITWLEEGYNSNKPWDQFVTELLTASGPQDKNGATTFFLANPTADKLTDTVSRLFLGVQLQCAQCHNHPFTGWKQTEYWGLAAFFRKVRADNVTRAARQGMTAGVNESGRGRQPMLPESAQIVPPRFFQGEQPPVNAAEPFRPVLARWLTAADNPFFARALVNRMWGQFFGRGFINPVDDMHEERPVSHPELLQALAGQFAANGFDVKYLIRAICHSQAYQRTSKPFGGNEDDVLFSHMAIKPLTPEQLYDSLEQVLGRQARPRGAPRGQRGGGDPRAAFVAFFQSDEGAEPTEYQAGIPQALRLMNSPQLNNTAALLNRVARSGPAQAVEQLYLATLARRPTAAEAQRLTAYVGQHGSDARKAYGDILWALLNSSEFTLNH